MYPTDPPEHDEVEISIFGRGFGETIVMHLGEKHWIIIDSCENPTNRNVVPIEYLENIGVDLTSCVDQIVISHFHSDHICGVARLAEKCSSAELVCPAAFQYRTVRQLVYAYGRGTQDKIDRPTGEFLDALLARKPVSPSYAKADMRIHQLRLSSMEDSVVELWALSPSNTALTKITAEVQQLLDQYKERLRLDQKPTNAVCIVLLGIVDDLAFLLGSDLEEVPDKSDGWSAIISSRTRPRQKCSCFKIPHHGSNNGYNKDVWSQMLEPNPVAAMTPFQHGKVNLPDTRCVELMLNQTRSIFLAGRLYKRKLRESDPMIRKRQETRTRILKERVSELGQIRLRHKIGQARGEWRVVLSGASMEIGSIQDLSHFMVGAGG